MELKGLVLKLFRSRGLLMFVFRLEVPIQSVYFTYKWQACNLKWTFFIKFDFVASDKEPKHLWHFVFLFLPLKLLFLKLK